MDPPEPVHTRAKLEFDRELFRAERRYEEFKLLRDQNALFRFDDTETKEPVFYSLLSRLEMESGSGLSVQGNVIQVPGFGRIRLAEAAIEPQRFSLTLCRFDLESEFLGEINLATAISFGIPGDFTVQSGSRETSRDDVSTGLDEDEEAEVIRELRDWLNSTPKEDEPFLFFMGHSLTPVEFFNQVERRTGFGLTFLRFLAEQSHNSQQRPRDIIRRAVDANHSE